MDKLHLKKKAELLCRQKDVDSADPESSEPEEDTGSVYDYEEKLKKLTNEEKMDEWYKNSEVCLKAFKLKSYKDEEMLEMMKTLCSMTKAMGKGLSSVFEYKIEVAAEVNFSTKTACFDTDIAKGIDTLNDLCTMVYDHYLETNRKKRGGRIFSCYLAEDDEFSSKEDYGIDHKSQKLIQMMSLTKKQGFEASNFKYNAPDGSEVLFRDSLDLKPSSLVDVIKTIMVPDGNIKTTSHLKFANAFPFVQDMLDMNVQQGYLKASPGGIYATRAEMSKNKTKPDPKQNLVYHTALIFEMICCLRYSVMDGEKEAQKEMDFKVGGEKCEIVPFLREASSTYPECNQMLAALMMGLNTDPNLLMTKEFKKVLNNPQHFGKAYMGKKDSKNGPTVEGVGCLIRIMCVIARAQITFATLMHEAEEVKEHLTLLEREYPGEFKENIKVHEQLLVFGEWLTSWRGEEEKRSLDQLIVDIGIHLSSSIFAQALTGLVEEERTPQRMEVVGSSQKGNKTTHGKRLDDLEFTVAAQGKKIEWLESQVKILARNDGTFVASNNGTDVFGSEQQNTEPKTDEYVQFVEAAIEKFVFDTYVCLMDLQEDDEEDPSFTDDLAEKYGKKYPDYPLIVHVEEVEESPDVDRQPQSEDKSLDSNAKLQTEEYSVRESKIETGKDEKINSGNVGSDEAPETEARSGDANWKDETVDWRDIPIVMLPEEEALLAEPEHPFIHKFLVEDSWPLTQDIEFLIGEDGTLGEEKLVDPKVTEMSLLQKETFGIMKEHYPLFGIPSEYHLDHYEGLSSAEAEIRKYREARGSLSWTEYPKAPRICQEVYDRNGQRSKYLYETISAKLPAEFPKEVKRGKGIKKVASGKSDNSFLADDSESSYGRKVLPSAEDDNVIVIGSSKSQSDQETPAKKVKATKHVLEVKESLCTEQKKSDSEEADTEEEESEDSSEDDDSKSSENSGRETSVRYSPNGRKGGEKVEYGTPAKTINQDTVAPNSNDSIANRRRKRKVKAPAIPRMTQNDSQSSLDMEDDPDEGDEDFTFDQTTTKKRGPDKSVGEGKRRKI